MGLPQPEATYRVAKELTGTINDVYSADVYPGGTLGFTRIQEINYHHDVRDSDGIRVV